MSRLLSLTLFLTATGATAAEPGRIAFSTCPGQGYIAYSYPAIGSCPCGDDRCFHPGHYYACCGDGDPSYKKAFWKRWLKAHFCGRSMLDGVACQCLNPPSTSVAAPIPLVPAPMTPPEPADERVVDEPPESL